MSERKSVIIARCLSPCAIVTFDCHSGFQSCILTPPIGHWEVSCDVTNYIFCKTFCKTEARNWTSGWTFLISVYWTDVLEMHVTVGKIVIWIFPKTFCPFSPRISSYFHKPRLVVCEAKSVSHNSRCNIISWAMHSSMTHWLSKTSCSGCVCKPRDRIRPETSSYENTCIYILYVGKSLSVATHSF